MLKNRIAAVIVAIAAVTAVTGVSAPPAMATTSQYISWIRTKVADADYLTDRQITKMGKTICVSLDKGVDIYELGEIAMDSGYTTDEAAAWVVGAVYFVCPRHKWMLS